MTSFDAKIKSDSYYPQIFSLAASGRNLYFSNGDFSQIIGDSIRGTLAGLDTVIKAALAFDPKPDAPSYSNFNNAFSVGKNKLFVGGYWNNLGSNMSPSCFAVFTLEPQNQGSVLTFSNVQSNSVTVNFIPGSGEHRLVVIAQGLQPQSPADNKNYISNAACKQGDSTGFFFMLFIMVMEAVCM